MGIMDRLGDLLKSYLNFDDIAGSEGDRGQGRFYTGDADLNEAYDELNEFLSGGSSAWTGKTRGKTDDWEDPHRSTHSASGDNRFRSATEGTERSKVPPLSLRADFEELGVPFGADEETCKAAHKKLLKTHHPDRHAGHEGNTNKANAKSARINAAYDNIRKWRQSL
jgi:curved DNA-binding protein CbpA